MKILVLSLLLPMSAMAFIPPSFNCKPSIVDGGMWVDDYGQPCDPAVIDPSLASNSTSSSDSSSTSSTSSSTTGGDAELGYEEDADPPQPPVKGAGPEGIAIEEVIKQVPGCLDGFAKEIQEFAGEPLEQCNASVTKCRGAKFTKKPMPVAGQPAPPPVEVRFSNYDLKGEVNFDDRNSCARVFGPEFLQRSIVEGDVAKYFNKQRYFALVKHQSPECIEEGKAEQNKAGGDPVKVYFACLGKKAKELRGKLLAGMMKCAAINDAAASTDAFEVQEKKGEPPVVCKSPNGFAFDYNSCIAFRNWYTGLVASETGMKLYNETDKVMQQGKIQKDVVTMTEAGDGQNAGIEASKRTTLVAASSEERLKVFYAGKATAILGNLVNYTDIKNIDNKCNTQCCVLFNIEGPLKIAGTSQYFPNQGVKSHMSAEAIKAGGDAVAAGLREKALKDQADLMKRIQAQQIAPEDSREEGIMKYCQLNPQDPRCVERGPARMLGGLNLSSSVGAQDFGILDSAAAGSQELDTSMGGTNAVAPGDKKQVAGIGTMAKDAAAARNMFNAPPAARGGGGGGGAGGGAGGASASASANGLSNDPGAEDAGAKEASIKVTSKSATYEGGAGYNGGGWRAGSGKKEESVTANPFASLFDKDKGRNPASTPEIDSSHSDLFTKISNRYGEVQKRKALMDVR